MAKRWVGVGLVLWAACGGDGGLRLVDAGTSVVDASTPLVDAWVSAEDEAKTLSLPLVPLTTARLTGVVQLVAGTETKLVMDTPFVFALGEGYPSELIAKFPSTLWAGCGMLKGSVSYRRLEGETSVISATIMDASAVRLRVSGEGEAEIVVFGEYERDAAESCTELPATGSLPFELRIKVFAWRPTGVEWSRARCGEGASVLLATSSTPKLEARLVNAAGEPFLANNVLENRQVSLTLEADAERTWHLPSAEAGLADLRWPDEASKVSVRAPFGAPLSVTVIDAAEVSTAEVQFVLGGHASTAVTLEDGSSLGEDGWRRVANRIVPIIERAYVGENVLCSLPNPAWFELISDTPSRCDVRPVASGPLDGAVVIPADHLGLSSYVIADGACTLRLRAAKLNHGKGFEKRFSITLHNVEELGTIP